MRKEDVHSRCMSRSYLPEVGHEKDKEFELVNMVNLLPKEIRREPKERQKLKVVKSRILKGWLNDRQEQTSATSYPLLQLRNRADHPGWNQS